jgi:uncharacterized protein YbjT (DUF2867 family)
MILVTGGTGFIGKTLIRQLAGMGKPVRTLLRPSQRSPSLPKGIPVEVTVCSLMDERGLRAALKGVTAIYHLAGTERQGMRADLNGVDIESTQVLSRVAAQAGVERIMYLSHLGADRLSAYPVLKAKAIAEGHLIHSGVNYTIFRSSIVFGAGDQFTTSLAKLLKLSPGFFLLPGKGDTLIQPFWVEDLVTCLISALDDERLVNQLVPIGGVEYLSFHDVVQTILQKIGIKRLIIPIMPAYLRGVAVFMEQFLPRFPISLFWLDYLAADRTCALDSVPRLFGLMPERFSNHLEYLLQETSSQLTSSQPLH